MRLFIIIGFVLLISNCGYKERSRKVEVDIFLLEDVYIYAHKSGKHVCGIVAETDLVGYHRPRMVGKEYLRIPSKSVLFYEKSVVIDTFETTFYIHIFDWKGKCRFYIHEKEDIWKFIGKLEGGLAPKKAGGLWKDADGNPLPKLPRAIKKRPKNYALLNKPRGEYVEIPHRSRYRKPA